MRLKAQGVRRKEQSERQSGIHKGKRNETNNPEHRNLKPFTLMVPRVNQNPPQLLSKWEFDGGF